MRCGPISASRPARAVRRPSSDARVLGDDMTRTRPEDRVVDELDRRRVATSRSVLTPSSVAAARTAPHARDTRLPVGGVRVHRCRPRGAPGRAPRDRGGPASPPRYRQSMQHRTWSASAVITTAGSMNPTGAPRYSFSTRCAERATRPCGPTVVTGRLQQRAESRAHECGRRREPGTGREVAVDADRGTLDLDAVLAQQMDRSVDVAPPSRSQPGQRRRAGRWRTVSPGTGSSEPVSLPVGVERDLDGRAARSIAQGSAKPPE